MSTSAGPASPDSELPPVDVRLVAPESRYEIDEGRLVYVSASDEPHGSRHSKVSALLEAYAGEDYDVASDMLTRTSETSDTAPDASVFPRARDEETGGRRLEELAFAIVSTERLSDAAKKAQKLADRGVRRIFAIDVSRKRAFEWSRDLGSWALLGPTASIEDGTLVAALPVSELVEAAKADDAVASALLAKKNRVLEAALARTRDEGKTEGKAEALIAFLTARGFSLSGAERERITAMRDPARLDAWLARAASCASVPDLLE